MAHMGLTIAQIRASRKFDSGHPVPDSMDYIPTCAPGRKNRLQILHHAVARAVVIGPLWLLLHRALAAIWSWRDPLVRSGLL